MILQLTAAGRTAFEAAPANFNITRVVLGSGYNYTLPAEPLGLTGTSVYDKTETLPSQVMSANQVRYTLFLDKDIGPFTFGEMALYSGSTLVAVAVGAVPVQKKLSTGPSNGNAMNLQFFISIASSNTYGFLQLSNSDSGLRLPNVASPDFLEPPYEQEPNSIIVNGLTPSDTPELAFSDYFGRWNFSARPAIWYEGTVLTATTLAVDIATAHGEEFSAANDHIIQFTSGRLRGYCRQLTSIGSTFFAWSTVLTEAPDVGDTFIIQGPQFSVVTTEIINPALQFQDEGVNLGTNDATTLDFAGEGAVATRDGAKVTVTVRGDKITDGAMQLWIDDTDDTLLLDMKQKQVLLVDLTGSTPVKYAALVRMDLDFYKSSNPSDLDDVGAHVLTVTEDGSILAYNPETDAIDAGLANQYLRSAGPTSPVEWRSLPTVQNKIRSVSQVSYIGVELFHESHPSDAVFNPIIMIDVSGGDDNTFTLPDLTDPDWIAEGRYVDFSTITIKRSGVDSPAKIRVVAQTGQLLEANLPEADTLWLTNVNETVTLQASFVNPELDVGDQSSVLGWVVISN